MWPSARLLVLALLVDPGRLPDPFPLPLPLQVARPPPQPLTLPRENHTPYIIPYGRCRGLRRHHRERRSQGRQAEGHAGGAHQSSGRVLQRRTSFNLSTATAPHPHAHTHTYIHTPQTASRLHSSVSSCCEWLVQIIQGLVKNKNKRVTFYILEIPCCSKAGSSTTTTCECG